MAVSVAVSIVAVVVGLNNGLGHTPALGWNSDYCANCSKTWPPAGIDMGLGGFQYESFIVHIADFMATAKINGAANGQTLQQLGYHYVNMDASWNLKERSPSGQLQPNPALWPNGLDYTVGKVHDYGLGFGLYGDRGTKDCAGNPGAQGHEIDDANFMAANKIDFYKEDSCSGTSAEGGAMGQYGRMRDALNATGYPIWFALCGWEPIYAEPPLGGNIIGNSARIGPDTGGGWQAVLTNIANALTVSQYAGPSASGAGGYWNDGSLMLTPNYLNHGAKVNWDTLITPDRHRTQFSAWSMLAMNILITGNLSALSPYVIETWSNPEVLAIDQDPTGHAGFRINASTSNATHFELPSQLMGDPPATLAECGGEPTQQTWTIGIPSTGMIRNPATKLCLNIDNCETKIIYDVCSNASTKTCGANEQFSLSPTGQIKSELSGGPCMTAAADGSVSVAPCTGKPEQSWQFANDSTLRDSQGRCLTASAAPPPPGPLGAPPAGIGRPLVGGAFAAMLINHASTPARVSCGPECLGGLGLDSGTSYTARDVWAHRDLQEPITSAGTLSAQLGPYGASAVFVLRPE